MATTPTGWWMYHGDPAHTGYVGSGSAITADAIKGGRFQTLHTLTMFGGPILSVPAVSDGFVYVGLANSRDVAGEIGGTLLKVELQSGKIASKFTWKIALNERDTHGFCGMGSTPSVIDGRVYFVAFNAKLYCLDRRPDAASGSPTCAIATSRTTSRCRPSTRSAIRSPRTRRRPAGRRRWWSATASISASARGRIRTLYSFVFCLDADSGNVVWIFCTNQYGCDHINRPNELPEKVVRGVQPPPGFTVFKGTPLTLGCSVWGCIAYDETLNRLYCPTGNGVPDGTLPTPGWSNGLLALDAVTGAFKAFYQFPAESNYRDSDYRRRRRRLADAVRSRRPARGRRRLQERLVPCARRRHARAGQVAPAAADVRRRDRQPAADRNRGPTPRPGAGAGAQSARREPHLGRSGQ